MIVDEMEDLNFVKRIVGNITRPFMQYRLDDLIELYLYK